MRNYRLSLHGFNALWLASCLALSPLAHATEPATRAKPFEWKSSEPLIKPPADAKQVLGVKDPSIVYYGNKYHVFLNAEGRVVVEPQK